MTRQFLDADARATYSQARIDVLRTIGHLATAEAARFVVVAGDVFETNRVGPRTVRRALEAMAAIPVPVFLLPGNHDPLDAASVYRSPTFERARPANVTVLDRSDSVEIEPGLEIIGAPWLTKRPLRDLVGGVCTVLAPTSNAIRVVVGHGVVDEPFHLESPAAISLSLVEEALGASRVHYVALGDRHSTTDVGSTGRVWYAGTPEPTAHDETAPGNVLVVDVDANTCSVTPVSIATWRFVQERFELNHDGDLDALADWLNGQPSKDRMVVRLTLAGAISLSQNNRLQAMIEEAREVFGAIEDWDPTRDLIVRPDDDDFADLALTGFAQKAVDRLRALATSDGPQNRTARDALALLVRMAHGGAAGTR